jgi:hypothetical protein
LREALETETRKPYQEFSAKSPLSKGKVDRSQVQSIEEREVKRKKSYGKQRR